MKLIALLVLTCLTACSNTRHMEVAPADAANATAAPAKDACSSGPCDAEVRCLPNGTCEIQCNDAGGAPCTVVVVPVDDDC